MVLQKMLLWGRNGSVFQFEEEKISWQVLRDFCDVSGKPGAVLPNFITMFASSRVCPAFGNEIEKQKTQSINQLGPRNQLISDYL